MLFKWSSFWGVSAKRIWNPEAASKRSISMASLFWIAAQAANMTVKPIRTNIGVAVSLMGKKEKIVLIDFRIFYASSLLSRHLSQASG